MSYIGKAPGFGIRNRYYYTATASQTLFSGADDNGQTLAYADSKYLDVYLNGVLLVAGTDYTATTLTSVSLTTGAAASDIVEIVAYDIFSVADTVSAANGGTFNGAVTVDSTLTASGLVTAQDGLVVDNDGATVATFDRATSDGDIVEFQKGGTTIGSIGVQSDDRLTIGCNDIGIGFVQDGDSISPWNDSTKTYADNKIDIGDSSNRFKDLYLSGGVYLGGTGAANYLDDYEEGTWTPAYNIGGASYTSQDGTYTKIGNTVIAAFSVSTSNTNSITGSGTLNITGLPFTLASGGPRDVFAIMSGRFTANNPNYGVLNSGTAIELRAGFETYTQISDLENSSSNNRNVVEGVAIYTV